MSSDAREEAIWSYGARSPSPRWSFPITDNVVLNDYQNAPFSRGLVRDDNAIRVRAQECVTEFDVRTPSILVNAGTLSGGNQQKVVLAKWLEAKAKVLILDHPTRGLDVGAKEEVYELVRAVTAEGLGVILTSDTLEETIGVEVAPFGFVQVRDCRH